MTSTPEIRDQAGAPGVSAPSLREQLERQFEACELVRPFRRSIYDPGDRLEYSITGVVPANTGRIVAEVERLVGGGFAGQVYRVELLEIQADGGPISGLTVGQPYAVKILKPASAFARFFRGFLYFLAYQAPFSAQVNPASVRVGVLWQKLIRRAAAAEFGDESAVCDTLRHLLRSGPAQLRRDQRMDRRTHLEVRGGRSALRPVEFPRSAHRSTTTARSTCTRSSSCGGSSSCCTRWVRPSWPASTNGGPARASPTR